jgi:prepilin peptidase CpaA
MGRPFAFVLNRIFNISVDLSAMIASWLPLVPLIVLLAMAAGWDLMSFTIPNFIQAGLIAAFAAFVMALGVPVPEIGMHLLAGFAGLVAGFSLFAFGYIGGGDAKLFACIALWLGFRDLAAYTLMAAILGGGLSLLFLSLRTLPMPFFLMQRAWALRLYDAKSGVPYGVALTAALFAILPQTEVFRLAATHV